MPLKYQTTLTTQQL